MSSSSQPTTVLITGFGPFLDITTNPSWSIASRLPQILNSLDGSAINLTIPPAPTPAAYHKILTQISQLDSYDVIIHIGLDVDSGPGVFKIEKSAKKEGYHDIPDVERRVFTRAENKKTFAKAPECLVTTLDIETAGVMWRDACAGMTLGPPVKGKGREKQKGRGGGGKEVDVRLSDDVGIYVCGFQYYVSMLYAEKKSGRRDVVFLHVPRLEGEEEVSVGVRVTEELIKALVAVQRRDMGN